MKLHNTFKLLALPLTAVALGSCLDFDMTGDEFSQTQKNVQSVVRQGKVDSINYRFTIAEDKYEGVANAITDNLAQAKGGIFAIRGGKEGKPPGTHQYQYSYALGPDMYSQYGNIPHSFFENSQINMTSSYTVDLKAYGGPYGAFGVATKFITPLLNMAEVDSLPEIKATYLLMYDYAAIEAADIYGPLPYNDLKTNKQDHPYKYDPVDSIYYATVNNIDTIVACFQHFESKPQWYKEKILKLLDRNAPIFPDRLEKVDKKLQYLTRFANSLKLRLAMHIVKVEGAVAQKWAEEAVASGVIEDVAQEASIAPRRAGFTNPLAELWNSWGDMRLGAGFEAVLKSCNHPYLDLLFTKNEKIKNSHDESKTLEPGKMVCGIRIGARVGKDQQSPVNPYNGFSKLKDIYINMAPLYLMKLSEVCFLRAEGALRGWNMHGTAAQFYEKGIRAGDMQDRKNQMVQGYDKAMDEYLKLEHAIPFTYVDPTGDTEPIESQIKIGVAWDESNTLEEKLEKIITQKYIAGFPNSKEAWVDLRRTGYPRMFDALNPGDGDGSLSQGDIIRRLPFADTQDAATAKDVKSTGLKALGGPDKQATRLWWDVKRGNF